MFGYHSTAFCHLPSAKAVMGLSTTGQQALREPTIWLLRFLSRYPAPTPVTLEGKELASQTSPPPIPSHHDRTFFIAIVPGTAPARFLFAIGWPFVFTLNFTSQVFFMVASLSACTVVFFISKGLHYTTFIGTSVAITIKCNHPCRDRW